MDPTSADGATILIVDDDAEVRSTFDQWLQAEGYSVRTAADGQEALQHVHAADAIIVDIRMPILDGVEFVRTLRSDDVHVPIAVVTGDYLIDDAIVSELDRLDTRVVFKPLWLDELTTITRDLVCTGSRT